jgi:hypothetical protein
VRRTRLERKTPLRSSGRSIKPKKRSAATFARVYGSAERVEFVRWLPCLVCAMKPCENAHTVTGGTGRKADARTIVPLCHTHHQDYDQHRGVFADAAERELMKASAPRVEALWQERRGLEPIGRVVARVLPTLTGEDA